MAAGIGAYAAYYSHDRALAAKVWQTLLQALAAGEENTGFAYQQVKNAGNCKVLEEIPWISTNFASQWCLNVIMALEFIRDDLPDEMTKEDFLI